jgi:hypothetical protein
MNRRYFSLTFAGVLCSAGTLPLGGCGSRLPGPQSPAAVGTSALTALLAPGGGSLAYPSIDGYSANFYYSTNTAVPNTSVALVTSTERVANVPGGIAPPGAILVAFTFKLNQSVTFGQWYRNPTTVSIPAAAATGRGQFALYGYDETTGIGIGWNPGTQVGTSITFSRGLGPVTLDAHMYLFLLTLQ